MKRFQTSVFETIELCDLIPEVSKLKQQGCRFVQLCATTLEDSCDLLYSFLPADPTNGELFGLIVNVVDGACVPSITELYPAAFVFENETHDLFGIDIKGINIDYQGEFYVVTEQYPMNPRAAIVSDVETQETIEETEQELAQEAEVAANE